MRLPLVERQYRRERLALGSTGVVRAVRILALSSPPTAAVFCAPGRVSPTGGQIFPTCNVDDRQMVRRRLARALAFIHSGPERNSLRRAAATASAAAARDGAKARAGYQAVKRGARALN